MQTSPPSNPNIFTIIGCLLPLYGLGTMTETTIPKEMQPGLQNLGHLQRLTMYLPPPLPWVRVAKYLNGFSERIIYPLPSPIHLIRRESKEVIPVSQRPRMKPPWQGFISDPILETPALK